jgi:predicted permease
MFARLRSLWHVVGRRSRFERDMDDELRFHIESRTADLMRSGLAQDEAARAARLEFGNPEAYQDLCREARRANLLDDAQLDVRFALRNIRRDATLSAAILVTLALGIGATATIFSLVSGVLLRPLPYPDPDRLLLAGTTGRDGIGRLFGPDYVEWRRQCRACEGVAAYMGTWAGALAGGAEPDRVRIGHVSDNFFATMGVQPMLGRPFGPADRGRSLFNDGPPTPVNAVVLGYSLWQRRFGGDPGVVGRTLLVEGDPAPVIGVMPAGFDFPNKAEAWVPAAISQRRGNSYLQIVVRRQPGAADADVQAELNAIALQLATLVEPDRASKGARVTPLRDFIVGDVRSPLLVFLGAVTLVLLIACANVANLLLAQAATRPKELAIRAALGARRSRIVRQLLTESLLLAGLGGLLGLLLSTWLLRMFVALAPPTVPRLEDVAIDSWVLVFTAGLSILTGLLFGLAPIVRTARPELTRVLHDGSGRTAGSIAQQRTRRTLVIAEMSLALVLLIGAGLLMKSFLRLQGQPTGFDPEGAITAAVTLPEAAYPDAGRAKAYYREALAALQSAGGVGAAGVVSALPLSPNGARINGSISREGQREGEADAWAAKLAVGGDYFRAVGIALLRGRRFDGRDTTSAPRVVIVSESLARTLWPGRDAIGQRLDVGFAPPVWHEVVGIVGDVRQHELGKPPLAAVYQPFEQLPDSRRWMLADMTFVVRTTGSPETFTPALRATLARLDPSLPLYDVGLMSSVIGHQVTDPRFYTMLLSAFSTLALFLACAGIYGVLSYSVTHRRHEIGIRMALGARGRDVMKLVVAEGMALVAVGAMVGVAGAYAATRVLSGFLYEVSVTDRPTFASIVVLLLVVAAVACYVPARRAATVDPLVALRHD